MAEIHVEKKRGTAGWVWVLLLVVLLVAAAVYLWQAGYINLGLSSLGTETLALLNAGGPHGA